MNGSTVQATSASLVTVRWCEDVPFPAGGDRCREGSESAIVRETQFPCCDRAPGAHTVPLHSKPAPTQASTLSRHHRGACGFTQLLGLGPSLTGVSGAQCASVSSLDKWDMKYCAWRTWAVASGGVPIRGLHPLSSLALGGCARTLPPRRGEGRASSCAPDAASPDSP